VKDKVVFKKDAKANPWQSTERRFKAGLTE
jgi:hypothetical protein